jgi:protoheme IX farnesyltransferase
MTFDKVKSYYNLAKPGIIYGNLITATAGFLFASRWHSPFHLYISMLLGLALIIGSGCVINNVIDKSIDAKMDRTKKRATVTGQISDQSALIYAAALGLIGSIILILFTNSLTFFVALTGFIIYVVVYGVAKRKTVYGTLIGALAGAVPPLVGYTAFTNYIDLAGELIVLILICWQVSHFYGIALYRKKDYKAAGLPVWPVVKGDWSAQLQAIAFIALFSVFSVALFVFGYCGYTYLITVLVLGLGWLWYSVLNAGKLSASIWGRKIFLSSLIVMLVISLALAFGPVLP